MIRRWRTLAIGLIAVAMLAGCVNIPTSGAVQSSQIDTDPDEVGSISLPDRPQPGQDMLQILQGFIRAGRGPQNNYEIAHDFLAPGTAWSGTERVLITSSAISPTAVDEDTLTVTVTVVAEVDGNGRYLALPVATTQTLTYDFTVVDGEFRISGLPSGTVLSPSGFSNAFRQYPLYFFDPSYRYLVPDVRWFPVSRVANRIVSELLAGPSPWLGSGVLQSVFPEGTTGRAVLQAPAVDVTLSAEVRAESEQTQLRMIQQLRASLLSISNVSASEIVVTADGLALDPAPEDIPPDSRFAVQEVIGGVDGQFGQLAAGGIQALLIIGTRANGLQPLAASLARDRGSVAVLGPAGVSIVRGTGDPVVVDARAGLIAPTLDPFGFVWSVPGDNPDGLQATGGDGTVRSLPIAADGQVVAIELSRDGTRLLVALATPDGPRLIAVGVLRDAAFAPVGLHTPFELRPAGSIVDVAWVDGATIAVLSEGESGTRVHLLPLGGPASNLGSVPDGVAIVGGNNAEAGLRVLSLDGTVYQPRSTGNWSPTGLVASFLGTQQ